MKSHDAKLSHTACWPWWNHMTQLSHTACWPWWDHIKRSYHIQLVDLDGVTRHDVTSYSLLTFMGSRDMTLPHTACWPSCDHETWRYPIQLVDLHVITSHDVTSNSLLTFMGSRDIKLPRRSPLPFLSAVYWLLLSTISFPWLSWKRNARSWYSVQSKWERTSLMNRCKHTTWLHTVILPGYTQWFYLATHSDSQLR